MATNYPTTLDAFTDPVATDALNSVTVPHATQHANANDAVVAVETELGVLPKGTFGSVVARLNSLAPLAAPSLTGTATVTASGAANIPLIVKGAVAQSAALQSWQDSTGTSIASISSGGTASVSSCQITNFIVEPTATAPYVDFSAANKLIIQTRLATNTGLIVQGAAAQSADLFQIQDSTAAELPDADRSCQLPRKIRRLTAPGANHMRNDVTLGTGGAMRCGCCRLMT